MDEYAVRVAPGYKPMSKEELEEYFRYIGATDETLQEYLDNFVIAYLNNILIFSKIYKEYIVYIRKVLTKLKEKALLIKLEKYEFYKQ